MQLIQRLVLRRTFARTLIVFLFVASIIMTTQVLNQALSLIDASSNLAMAARLFALFLPAIGVVILPLAVLVGLIQTFDTMKEDSETTVIFATGVHPVVLLVPVGVIAAALSVIVLVTSLVIEPLANRAVRNIVNSLRFDAINILASDSVLRELEPGLFVRGGPRSDDGTIQGVFILDRRNLPAEILYVAESARLTTTAGKTRLTMVNGVVQARDNTGRDRQFIAFGEYITDPEYFFSDLPGTFGPRQTSTLVLWRALQNNVDTGQGLPAMKVELVRRATDWLYPLVYSSFAAWLIMLNTATLGVLQRRSGWILPMAITVGGIIRVASFAALGRAGVSDFAAVGAFALPLGCIVLFGALAIATAQGQRGNLVRHRLASPIGSEQ